MPSPSDMPILLDPVARTFSLGIKAFGAHHKALAWHDAERMQRRFDIFAGLIMDIPEERPISVNDHGCGYGAMFDSFKNLKALKRGRYYGYDISPEMIDEARKRHPDPRAEFMVSHVATNEADYSFVSGTWNMKMWASDADWRVHQLAAAAWEAPDQVTAQRMGVVEMASGRDTWLATAVRHLANWELAEPT